MTARPFYSRTHMKNADAVKAAMRDVSRGMGVRSAATKHGLTRDRLRYYIQKRDAARNAFRHAIDQEKKLDKTQG